jgi:Tol biopolymer transport system component
MSFSKRLGFLLVLTILVPAALNAVVPVSASPLSLVPVIINAGAGDQFDPHVSGDWVAYTSDLGIRYYNFATNVDAQIPLGGSANDLLAGISGSRIVFSRVLTGVKTAVMLFDAATPLVAPIEIDPAAGTTRIGTDIGGNTVAYIDFGLQANGELVVHDLSTSTSVRITNDTVADGNPSVSPDGNVVVWEHCVTSLSNCEIWQAVRSGGVWTVTATTNSGFPQGNPETNGSVIVYDARRTTGPGSVLAHDRRKR